MSAGRVGDVVAIEVAGRQKSSAAKWSYSREVIVVSGSFTPQNWGVNIPAAISPLPVLIPQNWRIKHICLTFNKSVQVDAVLYPDVEILPNFQKGVQIMGVEGLHQVGADGLL